MTIESELTSTFAFCDEIFHMPIPYYVVNKDEYIIYYIH